MGTAPLADMMPTVILWIVVFALWAAMLGVAMYILICLSDLENDYLNPHDAVERVNRVSAVEVVLLACALAVCLAAGFWAAAAAMAPLLLWHADDYRRGKNTLDVTEVFSQAREGKWRRLAKLGAYLAVFVLVVFRLVEAAVGLAAAHRPPRGARAAAAAVQAARALM